MKFTKIVARQSPAATTFFAVAFIVIGLFLVANSMTAAAVVAFVVAALSLVGLVLQIRERRRP